jgi:NAD(P)-dependent dehydrogenase (short-subunit alcohol dehydrogenase family)
MKGKALVTGARRGIGKAIALLLAEEGFDVAVADLENSAELSNVMDTIRSRGRKSVSIAADIGKLEDHGRLLDQAESAIGPLTCLVNNAGVSVFKRGDLLDVTPESYDHSAGINTRGTFFLTQTFAKRVLSVETKTHRSIVNITSANASAVSIMRGEYCISKAGASMMSKLFAARLSNEGIGVYEIQPGFIETEMTAPAKEKYSSMIDNGMTVIKRWGTPEDVARIAVTMASGLLPYTAGQMVLADGGLMMVRY